MFRIYDLYLEPTALAEEPALLLLDGLLDPAVVVCQVELAPLALPSKCCDSAYAPIKVLRLGVCPDSALGVPNSVNQLLTHFLGYLIGVVINLLIFEQRLSVVPSVVEQSRYSR